MKNIGNLFVRLFVISLLTFRYFSTIVSLFGAGAAPFFTAPAPAPAPTKMCRLRRLRLRLRNSASLVLCLHARLRLLLLLEMYII